MQRGCGWLIGAFTGVSTLGCSGRPVDVNPTSVKSLKGVLGSRTLKRRHRGIVGHPERGDFAMRKSIAPSWLIGEVPSSLTAIPVDNSPFVQQSVIRIGGDGRRRRS